MKTECSLVRDLLPLYVEDMVRIETREFIRAHLDTCHDCAAELASMWAEAAPTPPDAEQIKQETGALVTIKKKLRKKSMLIVSTTAACLILLTILFNIFPLHHFTRLNAWEADYFKQSEVALLLYAGSPSDRAAAQSVLRLADAAFSDCIHTREEAKALYGLLSRYATPSDSYPGTVRVDYSLELWSAHLGSTKGHIWVYYSNKGLDADGNTTHGSSRIPALWTVERDEGGAWVVTAIKEHP